MILNPKLKYGTGIVVLTACYLR